jgi:hypothetical protein
MIQVVQSLKFIKRKIKILFSKKNKTKQKIKREKKHVQTYKEYKNQNKAPTIPTTCCIVIRIK